MNRPLFIQWNERTETNINIIDEQHKGIVSIINSLYALTTTGTGNNMLYSCISDTMKNYSRIHFITEEGFLEESGFEGIDEHRKKHRKLSLDIERAELKSIMANDSRTLLEFLKKWWLEHINEQDMLYARFLREHG